MTAGMAVILRVSVVGVLKVTGFVMSVPVVMHDRILLITTSLLLMTLSLPLITPAFMYMIPSRQCLSHNQSSHRSLIHAHESVSIDKSSGNSHNHAYHPLPVS